MGAMLMDELLGDKDGDYIPSPPQPHLIVSSSPSFFDIVRRLITFLTGG